MTETEWLACTSPRRLLEFLRPQMSDRKARLFVCACCRLWWDALPESASRAAVIAAERYVEGAIDRDELRAAYQAARAAEGLLRPIEYLSETYGTPEWRDQQRLHRLASRATDAARTWLGTTPERSATAEEASSAACLALVREIFGNPFRGGSVAPAWLHWNERTVPKLALAIYDERAFDRLPILGDALEDAGCADSAILSHCRSAVEHVRGCWVLDLLLERG